jgi:hypothetical protein
MMMLQKDIYRMCWTFLIAPAGNDGFLTSDNPVGFFHPSEGSAPPHRFGNELRVIPEIEEVLVSV